MKYYIYFDSTSPNYADGFVMTHYTALIYPDNNYLDKRDFFNKCVLRDVDNAIYDPEHDHQHLIMCIDVDVCDNMRVYCFDSMADLDTTLSDTGITKIYFLGEIGEESITERHNDGTVVYSSVFFNEHRDEYAEKMSSLFKQVGFERCGETFVLRVSANGSYELIHIDRDGNVNKNLKINW